MPSSSHQPPAAFDTLLPALMEKWRVPGVSVAWIAAGELAGLRQYGVANASTGAPLAPESIFEACSMTKPLFAYAALKLAEEGTLDLHTPLVHYLGKPYIASDTRHENITAWMVLTHSSGLPNWRPGGRTSSEPLALEFEPGSATLYSGEGYWFLQRTIEQITRTPLEEWLKERLLAPLGMSASSLVWHASYAKLAAAGHTASGEVRTPRTHFHEANAAFSLYTTPAEYARFLLEMMRADRTAPHSLAPPLLEAMLTPQRELEGTAPIPRHGLDNSAKTAFTSLGWRIDKTPACIAPNRIYHSGSNQTGFRCYAEFTPHAKHGIVIMTNADNGDHLWRAVVQSPNYSVAPH